MAIALRAGIAALAYGLLQVPFQIVAGGISGVGIIIHHATGWPVGVLFFVLNLPLLWWGCRALGGVDSW
ncbi:MAG: YitT family protein [Desulfobacterales bacterium]